MYKPPHDRHIPLSLKAHQAVPPVSLVLPPPAFISFSDPNTQPLPSRSYPFYGHEYIAQLSARFLMHLFAWLPSPPQFTHSPAKLPHFIAYVFHRTKLQEAVTYVALVLLQRLKARFSTGRS